jgi:hypothetical protein
MRYDFMGGPKHFDAAMSQPHADLAHSSHISHSMTDQDCSVSFVDNFLHPIEALFLKDGVSYREDFVEYDNFRIQVRRHREN